MEGEYDAVGAKMKMGTYKWDGESGNEIVPTISS
jgi:hypothetical protein